MNTIQRNMVESHRCDERLEYQQLKSSTNPSKIKMTLERSMLRYIVIQLSKVRELWKQCKVTCIQRDVQEDYQYISYQKFWANVFQVLKENSVNQES